MKKLELDNLRNMIREVLSKKLVTEVALDSPAAEEETNQGQAAPPAPVLGDTETLRQRTAQRQAAASGGDTTEKAKAALSSVILPAIQQISDNNPAAMLSIQSMSDADLGSLVKQLMANTSEV
tara:strand:+ start:37 stop:405 length:369 start_codon:yes stop_codon:yes gene_type:complete